MNKDIFARSSGANVTHFHLSSPPMFSDLSHFNGLGFALAVRWQEHRRGKSMEVRSWVVAVAVKIMRILVEHLLIEEVLHHLGPIKPCK